MALPGYVLYRNDRINQVGGGVDVYIRVVIETNFFFSSPLEYFAGPKFHFVEVALPVSNRLLLGVCYLPPKLGGLDMGEYVFLRLMFGCGRVFLLEEFSRYLLKRDRYDFKQPTTMVESCCMYVLPIGPTHHAAESDPLLYLLVVSVLPDIIHLGHLSIPSVVKHDLIFCVSSLTVPPSKPKVIKCGGFKINNECCQ